MVDLTTPVIVGVGEYSERLDDKNYQALSPVKLAVKAAINACDDALSHQVLREHIDTLAAVRTFEDTSARMAGPFGKANNFPAAIAQHLGAKPSHLIWEIAGGQSPQQLVAEMCAAIASGKAEMCLLAGAEAISTVRHLSQLKQQADWSETFDAEVEDRGPGAHGISTRETMRHGIIGAPPAYALLEQARRARLNLSQGAYLQSMAELFAPFTEVAASNPHSMSAKRLSVEQLAAVTDANRMIADPYPRYMVARDQVNQSASLLITSVGKAKALGIDESKWIYLHGHASLTEKGLLRRADMGASPAAVLAAKTALEVAGITQENIDYFDLYSCFPVPVFNICDALNISPTDPRGLTVVGGLPFFGGAGNNYSMHAIASIVRRLRENTNSYGFVGANGGFMSKYAVGVYSAKAKAFTAVNNKQLQRQIEAVKDVDICYAPEGKATLETYTVSYKKGVPELGIVVGRVEKTGQRFIANIDKKDSEGLQVLLGEEPLGKDIYVKWTPRGNRVCFDPLTLTKLYPQVEPAFRDDYEFCSVERRGHLLEVAINRPEVRNCLHPPAHEELASIFDAFYADKDLWVVILTGAGSDAFCTGNDLKYSASGKPMYIPASGFGGLTLRKNRDKPIIVAVNGFAMGGGLEICLAADIVVVDANAQLALSEVKVGLFAGAGGLVRLPRQIPEKVAKEMILTGRRIGADEALRLGLASRVAPTGKALDIARDIANEILDSSPTSVRLSMQVMEQAAAFADVNDAMSHPYGAVDELLSSEDMTEGVMAFAQKRKPQWKNQ